MPDSATPFTVQHLAQALFANLTDHTGLGLCVIDRNYTITWVNHLTRKLYGDDLVGAPCYQAFSKLSGICSPCPAEKIFAGAEDTVTLDWLARAADGKKEWSQVILSPLRDDEGEIIAVLQTIIPATEKKTAFNTLQESEQKYRMLFEKASDAIYLIDVRSYTIIDCNQQASRQTGYAIDKLRDMEIATLHPPDERPLLAEKFGPVVEEGSFFSVTGLHHRRNDGSLFPVEISVTRCSIGGTPVNLAIIRDVTRNTELRKQLDLFRKLTENSNQGCGWTRLDGTIEYLNPALARMIGAGQDSLLGTSLLDHYPEKNRRHLENNVLPHVLEGHTWSGELSVTTLAGREIPTLENHFLIRDDRGEPLYFAAMVSDLTGNRATERERIRIKNLESLGNLAGGIAHDFNNLMMVIYGNIELALLTDGVPIEARNFLMQSQGSIRRARQLSGRLLTFAHGGDGERKHASLSEVLKNSCRLALEKHNQDYRLSFASPLPMVRIDPTQVEQVFSQILTNAREATGDTGCITVSAATEHIDDDAERLLPGGDYVTVTIKDNGPGMEESVLHRAFDPYFSTKNRDGTRGTGLGLTICHSIISRHGGHISIESTPGHGTQVIVRLPAVAGQWDSAYKDQPPKVETLRKRILIMDDEPTIGELVGKMLNHIGYKATVAADGNHGVCLYRQAMEENRPFFLIITDLTVPGGMGGVEMIRQIRELTPDAKAIVASGYSDNPVMTAFRKFGFLAAMVKPYSLNKLRDILNEIDSP